MPPASLYTRTTKHGFHHIRSVINLSHLSPHTGGSLQSLSGSQMLSNPCPTSVWLYPLGLSNIDSQSSPPLQSPGVARILNRTASLSFRWDSPCPFLEQSKTFYFNSCTAPPLRSPSTTPAPHYCHHLQPSSAATLQIQMGSLLTHYHPL